MLADWLSWSFHTAPRRGLWLLLGKVVVSRTPSSPGLGLGSTDHSSFTGGERDGAEHPVCQDHSPSEQGAEWATRHMAGCANKLVPGCQPAASPQGQRCAWHHPGQNQHGSTGSPWLWRCHSHRDVRQEQGPCSPTKGTGQQIDSSAGLTLGQVLQLHHAEIPRRTAATPTPPAAPTQRQHHHPVDVGEHQGHANSCGQTGSYCLTRTGSSLGEAPVPQVSDIPPQKLRWSGPQARAPLSPARGQCPQPWPSTLTHGDSCYDGGHKEREEDTAGDREALLAPRQAAPPALAQHLEEKQDR